MTATPPRVSTPYSDPTGTSSSSPTPEAEGKTKRISSQNFQRLARRISISTTRKGMGTQGTPGIAGIADVLRQDTSFKGGDKGNGESSARNMELGLEQDPPEATSEDDRRSETSSTRRRLDMLAVGFSVPVAGAEASYYDREGDFWEGFNRAEPSDATGNEKERAEDPKEDKPDPGSQHRIFKGLKRIRQSLKPSKKSKDDPANISRPPSDSEVPGAPEDSGRTPHRESPMASNLPAMLEPVEAHRALEDGLGDDTLHFPPPGHPSVLGSHRPVSKVTRLRTSWKSLWHPSPGDQPEITTVYSCRAENRDAVAMDPSEPAKVPPQSETAPGNYATHAVLPPSPPHTPTDDSDDGAPNENPEVHSPRAFCGLCSMLFPHRSTPHNDPAGADISGVGMDELRVRTEDDITSINAMSTRLAMSTEREQITHRTAHDAAIEVERWRFEAERLRIEEAAASRAHELLILDREIELARIHAGSPAPGPTDSLQG